MFNIHGNDFVIWLLFDSLIIMRLFFLMIICRTWLPLQESPSSSKTTDHRHSALSQSAVSYYICLVKMGKN